ncbi:MAG TPA: CRTAC1 family protein [Planctomycetota bacterium]|nr:CRTAC1 family protein [Planctomycetota bacterium]
MRTRRLAAVATFLVLLAATGEIRAGELVFEEAKDTGLAEIMDAWKREREALQEQAHPGKRDSHWWWPTAVSAGDLDGDGDVDLTFSHHGSPGTRVFTNQLKEKGTLTFLDLTKERTLSGSFDPMIGDGSTCIFDYDGDGTPDVMSISDESKAWAALNDGRGRFRVVESPLRIPQACLGDVNGDGLVDVTSPFAGGAPFLNRGGGKYERADVDKPPIGPAGWSYRALPKDLAFPEVLKGPASDRRAWPICVQADLDGDGRPEILVNLGTGYAAQGFCLFRDAADGCKDITPSAGLPYGGRVSSIYDFNGDGALDLLITASTQSGIYLNDGKARFTRVDDGQARSLSNRPAAATTLDTLADFDEDSRPEMLVITFRTGTQSGLFRNAGGRFEPSGPRLRGCWQFVVCDMDGDGRLDIVAGTNGGPVIHLNRTPPAGRFLNVRLAGPLGNVPAVDALVEAFAPAVDPDRPRKPLVRVRNNTPGIPAAMSVCAIGHSPGGNLPVHLGLGDVDTVDLRVTFPGGKVVEVRNVKAAGEIRVNANANP